MQLESSAVYPLKRPASSRSQRRGADMKKLIPSAVFLLSCLLISPAAGHDCWGGHHCGDGWNCGDHHGSRGALQSPRSVSPSYTATAPKVVDGKISEIIYLPGATADSAMVEARVVASGLAIVVRLAPVGLLKQNQLVLREGDPVSVTGFEVSGMDGDQTCALPIRKGDKRVVLRSEEHTSELQSLRHL